MSDVLTAAAEHIAVSLIREAYAHLPARRAAGAVSLADTEPLVRALKAITLEAYSEGMKAGVRRGRLELAREMEADWKPIAERVRSSAGQLTHAQREAESERCGGSHLGGPVPVWGERRE